MTYWILTTEFPPIHGGGISTYCWHTSKMLEEKGYKVKVFINDYSVRGVVTERVSAGVEVVRFYPNQDKKGEALHDDVRLSLEFAYVVEQYIDKEGMPDVVEVQDYLGIGYYLLQKKQLLYKAFKDLKVVLTMHAPSFLYLDYNQVPLYEFPTYWIGEMEKASIRMADLVISPSQYLIDQVSDRVNLSDKNVVQLFNPYHDTKATLSTIGDDIVFLGKLTPQKGCLELLAYMKDMWDAGLVKPLTIIGGGQHFFYPEGKDLIDVFRKKYANYIANGLLKFEGNLPPDRLKERLKKVQVVIIPSIVENLPYAAIEVMEMGKVVLASVSGGQRELIHHGETGFLFNHAVKGDFAAKLNKILDLSKEEMQEMGEKAKQQVLNITNYKVVYEQKERLMQQLLKEPNDANKAFQFVESLELNENQLLRKEGLVKGRLSVVVPYYNMGPYIEDTLASLQKVTYPDVEVLVINDGSSDMDSIERIEQLSKQYNIKVIHKTNEGLSLTRNHGAELATGEYLAFLDADDTVEPEYYTRSIEVMETYENVSFTGCWAQYFGESKGMWPTFNPEPPYLLTHNMINSSALVYKTEHFLSFGKNDPKMVYGMEDYDSVIAMVKNGARGVAFPELWWNYRIRKDSMQQAFTKNKELYLYRLMSKKHASFYAKYASEVVNLLNHNGPGIHYKNPSEPTGGGSFLKGRLKSIVKQHKLLRFVGKKVYQFIRR